ncbi:MAG: hypothetical protein KKE24_04610 [Candidatus Thermoplasmatota archaeon]|nr:hypothetical protein [Candidatus Thermoplasmatota archaeon]
MKCPKCGENLVWNLKHSRYYCTECEDFPMLRDESERQFIESVPRELKRIGDALWTVIYIAIAMSVLSVIVAMAVFMNAF